MCGELIAVRMGTDFDLDDYELEILFLNAGKAGSPWKLMLSSERKRRAKLMAESPGENSRAEQAGND